MIDPDVDVPAAWTGVAMVKTSMKPNAIFENMHVSGADCVPSQVAQAGIENVAQAVTQEVETEHDEHNGGAGKEGHPG